MKCEYCLTVEATRHATSSFLGFKTCKMSHGDHGTTPETQRTTACHQQASGFSCKAIPAVEAQRALAKAVAAAAVCFKISLQQQPLSAPAQVHENKKLSASSSVDASSTALLPLPECSSTEAAIQAHLPVVAAIALPAVIQGSPSSHRYRPCTLLPAQCKIEEKASNPAALEKPIQAAPQSQMLAGTEDVKSMTENDKSQQVLHERSAAEDGTAPKIANTREADSLTWRPALNPQVCEHMKNERSFADAPWRRKPAPISEHPHANTAMNASAALKRLPVPPPAPWSWSSEPSPDPDRSSHTCTGAFARRSATVTPGRPPCSSTTWTRNVMAPPPAPPRTVTSTSSSMCERLCSQWRGLPVPPPHPTTTALLAAARSTSQNRKDRAENSTGARSNTQKRRDRAKNMRIRKFNRQRDSGHDVPTTGAASLRRKQRQKAALNREADKVHGRSMAGRRAPLIQGMTRRIIRAPPKSIKYRAR